MNRKTLGSASGLMVLLWLAISIVGGAALLAGVCAAAAIVLAITAALQTSKAAEAPSCATGSGKPLAPPDASTRVHTQATAVVAPAASGEPRSHQLERRHEGGERYGHVGEVPVASGPGGGAARSRSTTHAGIVAGVAAAAIAATGAAVWAVNTDDSPSGTELLETNFDDSTEVGLVNATHSCQMFRDDPAAYTGTYRKLSMYDGISDSELNEFFDSRCDLRYTTYESRYLDLVIDALPTDQRLALCRMRDDNDLRPAFDQFRRYTFDRTVDAGPSYSVTTTHTPMRDLKLSAVEVTLQPWC